MAIKIKGGDKWKGVIAALVKEKVGVKIGVLEGATNDKGESVAEYGFYNEYGTEHIPSRPFMRQTVKEQSKGWAAIAADHIKANKPESVRRAIELMAIRARDDIIDKIRSNMPPANADSTIAIKQRKSGDEPKTLMDDKFLVKSIDYQIVEGK